MAIKSAYREKIPAAENSAPDIPERVEPSETVRVFSDEAEPSIGVVSADEIPEPDEATLALQNQLAHLKKSEEFQRQYAQHMQAQRAAQAAPAPTLPEGRADRIALWRQHGLTDDDASFLEAHPDMIDHPQTTQQAVAAATRAGLERGSEDFNNMVENAFNTLMGRAEAQAQPASTPAFFEPPEPARSAAAPDRAALYAAAPSRRETGGPREPTSPRQVKLSPIEQEMARNLGLSDVAYAEGKIRLLRAKAAGEIQ